MGTTDRIRAAATLVWLGLALANHARAVDLRDRERKYDSVANVRIEDARLSLHTERLPLHELIAKIERSGLARIEVHGDVSAITVSDSFGYMDIAQALRRVLSAHSNVLVDRAPQGHGPRAIVLILLASPAGERTGPGPESDRVASGSAAIGVPSPADSVVHAGLSSASQEERAAAAEELAYRPDPEELGHADQAPELLAEREGRKSRAPLRRGSPTPRAR